MNLPKCENSDVILLNTARGHLYQQMKMAPDMTFDDENDINIQNNTKEKISQRKNIFIQQRYHTIVTLILHVFMLSYCL